MSDGARTGQLRVEHEDVVDIGFAQLRGPSAPLALMKSAALRHQVVDASLAAWASELAQEESVAAADGLEASEVASAAEITGEQEVTGE